MKLTQDKDGRMESGRSLILAIIQEALSAQMFSGPTMYSTTGRAILLIRLRRAKPWRSPCATGEEDLEAMRLTRATDRVLLHSVAEWQCFLVLIRVSKTRWWSRTPAISKSELVRLSVGLESDTMAVMSGGNCTRHTVGTTDLHATSATPTSVAMPIVVQVGGYDFGDVAGLDVLRGQRG